MLKVSEVPFDEEVRGRHVRKTSIENERRHHEVVL